MSLDRELEITALSFWCSATNMMVLPLGLFGPIVMDITAILGTFPTDLPVDNSLFQVSIQPGLEDDFQGSCRQSPDEGKPKAAEGRQA
ncbi:hypothetical protein ACFXTH_013125 [Malus domestica]